MLYLYVDICLDGFMVKQFYTYWATIYGKRLLSCIEFNCGIMVISTYLYWVTYLKSKSHKEFLIILVIYWQHAPLWIPYYQ